MATEQATTMPVNGNYPYLSHDQVSQTASAMTASANSTALRQSSSSTQDIPKDEVAWYFVEQYYTTLSKSPDRLYVGYNA